MHATSFEGEPLGHSPRGTGQVKVLAGDGHDRRAGHSTLGTPASGWTPSQTYPFCFPPAADCAGSQGLLYGQPCLHSCEDLSPRGHVPARLDRLPAAQLWVTPRPAVPGWPLCAPPPPTHPLAQCHCQYQPRGMGQCLPQPPPKHNSALPPGPFHSAHRGQPGTADGNGQLLCPRTVARWGFCVLHPPGPWSPWVQTAG